MWRRQRTLEKVQLDCAVNAVQLYRNSILHIFVVILLLIVECSVNFLNLKKVEWCWLIIKLKLSIGCRYFAQKKSGS